MDGEVRAISAEEDHFSLFGLERRLRLDPANLERVFLRLSREFHPDRHGAAAPEVRATVQRNSARVNDAARTLRDPVARAEYLLALEGVTRPEGEVKYPPDLLMEVFDLRERLAEGTDPAAAAKSRALSSDADAKLETLFGEHDEASDPASRRAVLLAIRDALDRKKFLGNLAREVAETLGTG